MESPDHDACVLNATKEKQRGVCDHQQSSYSFHAGISVAWGLALAPSNFGKFRNDLLVGNFGNGRISAYDAKAGTFLGQVLDLNGNILSIDGLWTITFGNGGAAGLPNELFFSAGFNDEADGLFGKLAVIQ